MYLIEEAWRLARMSVAKFFRDNCITLSSSISYYFLLSLIPLTTLGLMVVSFIQRRALATLGVTQDLTGAVADNIHVVVPFISKKWLETYVVTPGTSSSYKIITLVLLPIVAGLVFSILGGTYRKIFRLPRRHMVVGQLIASGFAVFIILTLFASNFVLAITVPALERALEGSTYLSDVYLDAVTDLTSRYDLISPIVLMLFFLLTVRIYVNITIRWRYRLFAGGLFCGLWLAAKALFGLYINEISDVNLLYGSLSSIVVLLMWIFYSSIALLFSLEVLYVLNAREHRPPFAAGR